MTKIIEIIGIRENQTNLKRQKKFLKFDEEGEPLIKELNFKKPIYKDVEGKTKTYYINSDIISELKKVSDKESIYFGKTIVILKNDKVVYFSKEKDFGGNELSLFKFYDTIYTDMTIQELLDLINE